MKMTCLAMCVTVWTGATCCADPATTNKGEPTENSADRPSADQPSGTAVKRVSIDVARDRARLMHDIYVSTLDVMHERYFHGERAIVPARAMEDIFAEIERHSQTQARWISVNTKPMSVDHEPESEFEKQAAREIADGKTDVESVEGGFYRRARAIPLTSGCISCHDGFFRTPSKKPKYAGLVISIPVQHEPAVLP
ncbi:MAG: DUF3365 domain-containing protein [Fuerstiella sp.]